MEKKEELSTDPNASKRKSDHIELSVKSRTGISSVDKRFHYEPFLSGHPAKEDKMPQSFLGKHFDYPIWISSMTGGTEKAKSINSKLARIAGKFKLGMGLGSCRSLLYSDKYLEDFSIRKYMGDQPLYANLGIAQVQELVDDGKISKIAELIDKLEANGLIVHINPIQEFIQPEGDDYSKSPQETISRLMDALDKKIIVKEVGQGFGPQSLRAMMQMPLEAIDFAAFGGTNFATLELSRTSEMPRAQFRSLSYIGHPACEMIEEVNKLKEELGDKVKCRQFIISGGISNFLDGYYGIQSLHFNSIYGMASTFLKYALKPYEQLEEQIDKHIEGLKMANAFLRIK